MSDVRTAGAIYDLGYQHYKGVRLGRMYAFRTLLAQSYRTAFGLGRGERAKFLPVIVMALVYLPALISMAMASQMGPTQAVNYADHMEFTALFLALFAAGQAPELVVADRQQGVLTLYLSRPIRGVDYALAKLLALAGAMLVLTLGPQLTMFAGTIAMNAEPWKKFVTEWPKLIPMLGGTLLVSTFFAAIGLALASMASRKGYGSAAVIAFFLLTAGFSELVRNIGFGGMERYAVLANPTLVISGFAKWLFEIEARRRSAVGRADLPGYLYLNVLLASTAIGIALLVNRYRKGDT